MSHSDLYHQNRVPIILGVKTAGKISLTPWSNDAVTDPPGEVIYIRDEDRGVFWSPTPGPVPGSKRYTVRHGFGYTVTESYTMNLKQQVSKWVPRADSVKIVRLRLVNTDLSSRHLSVFHYNDWVLGVQREKSTRYVITQIDSELHAILAQNYYNNEFAGRVAFSALFTEQRTENSFSSDRQEFIGRNHDIGRPQAVMAHQKLGGKEGALIDSCAATQSSLYLESGSSVNFYYLIGEAESEEEANALIHKYRDSEKLEASFNEIRNFWSNKLDRITVQTPAVELDLLANGWLQYQNIACRMWARSGFYQSGGAFGFRDQLQDAGPPYCSIDLWRGTKYCCMPPTNFPKETCCTGGTRPRVGAYARGLLTTCFGFLS
ncbi:MAG: hypothetical protein U5K69_08140 [Balneolaceae bacterium]|nr:hypothetical protein [Balneolaceae bacterium]